MLERAGFVVRSVGLEEVVVAAKLVLDLTDEVITPLDQHVLGH